MEGCGSIEEKLEPPKWVIRKGVKLTNIQFHQFEFFFVSEIPGPCYNLKRVCKFN